MRIRSILALVVALALLPSAFAFAETCQTDTCHSSLLSLKYKHQPMKEGKCLACHVLQGSSHPVPGQRSFTLTSTGAELCYSCHEKFRKKVLHAPVQKGECLACHNPHGSADRKLLEDSVDVSSLCFDCHDASGFRLPFVHGPAAAGACTECHSPHDADRKSLLREDPRENCTRCHEDFAQQMKEAPVVHSPVRKSPCSSCHTPHASEAKYLLKTKMPDLCVTCHTRLAKTLSGAKYQHTPLTAENGCGNCHSSHFAQSKGLLPFDEKKLCLGCHGEQSPGSALKDMEKELKAGKKLHGPLKENECSPCHDPHGSAHGHLLRGEYPEGAYQPYKEGAYDFCLTCHDKSLLRFKDTTIYTKFRNGNLNLHYVHVVNNRKGRSCKFCHAPHASDGEKLIDKGGAPFGGWKIPIRLDLTESGGGCAPGCHVPQKYDRKLPVEYPKRKK